MRAISKVVVVVIISFLCLFLPIFSVMIVNSQQAFSEEPTTLNESQSIDSALNSQISEIILQKQSLTPTQQKIDWNLLQTIQEINEQASNSPVEDSIIFRNFSTSMLKINNEGVIEVKLTVSDNISDEQINQLKNLGMDIQITLPEYGIVEGSLPYDAVETVAGLDFVKHVGTPGYAILNTGSVTSAGDSVLKADSARSIFGINGSGSKIGVMSDGVDHLADSVASGDLPSGVQVLKNDAGDEGTAMLEIIHDLAPGANLAFYTGFISSSDMVAGIGALQSAGCNIIVDDIGWYDQPKFEDGPIAQRARQFVNNGGVYVTAAGNQREDHYNHQYVRTTGPGGDYPYAHNYGSGNIGNTFTIPTGGDIVVFLQWNNQWGLSGDDFDLFLIRSSDGSVLAASADSQDGDGDPWEGFSWDNDTGYSVSVFVAVLEYSLVSAPSSLMLDYYVLDYHSPLQYSTPNDSLFGHAAVGEVLSTAAVDAATPNTLESYSSCGPGTIYFPSYQQRQVPTITGVDCVHTRVGADYWYDPFCGTSAAAPHIAAIAALVWDANPTLTSSQVRSAITSTAVDLSTTGFDYYSGWGRANASAAVNSVLFTLNTSSSSGGTVTTPGIGSFKQYTYGQVVNIVATNDSCDYFVNWSGDTATIANTSASSTTITMNDSYSITANFASTGVTYNLTVSSGGNGSTTPSGTTSQNCNASVPIVATADPCYKFLNWSGPDAGSVSNVNAASTAIFMNGAKTIQANFVAAPEDVNCDSNINVLDMIRIGQHWGQTGSPGWIPEDVNKDGTVNVLDMIFIGQHWTG